MTSRRFTHAMPTERRTGGEDRPTPACLGVPEPFDVLIDPHHGDNVTFALRESRDLCGVNPDGTLRKDACPLAAACLFGANAHEPWVGLILGAPVKPKPRAGLKHDPEVQRAKAQARADAFNAARLENLRELIASGARLEEVCARLDVTESALWKWCQRHDRLDLWKQIQPPRPEALVKVRRRGQKVAA